MTGTIGHIKLQSADFSPPRNLRITRNAYITLSWAVFYGARVQGDNREGIYKFCSNKKLDQKESQVDIPRNREATLTQLHIALAQDYKPR